MKRHIGDTQSHKKSQSPAQSRSDCFLFCWLDSQYGHNAGRDGMIQMKPAGYKDSQNRSSGYFECVDTCYSHKFSVY
jgi:hypothetical protein